MYWIQDWLEDRKDAQNEFWAMRIIRSILVSRVGLVNLDTAVTAMSYLYNIQDNNHIKALFLDPTRFDLSKQNNLTSLFSNVKPTEYRDGLFGFDFKGLPVLEKVRNNIYAECKKVGVISDVVAQDPTSVAERKKDAALLKKKKEIEGVLSYVYQNIGEQPVSMSDYQDRFKEKPASGNLEDFDKMGFDTTDPQDVHNFMEHFHKLDWEIALQSVLDFISQYNLEDQIINNWVADALAKRAVSFRQYVSQETGAIVRSYLDPTQVYVFGPGRSFDFNDSNAKGYEISVTVREFLDILGDKVDLDRDWYKIILAVQSSNPGLTTNNITAQMANGAFNSGQAFSYNGTNIYWGGPSGIMSMRINLGYIEFTSQIKTTDEAYGAYVSDEQKKIMNENSFKNHEQVMKEFEKRYPQKSKYQTVLYKAYYLPIGNYYPFIFDFGPVSYQDVEGGVDMKYNYSIITYKDPGDPLVITCIPYIDTINELFFKMRHDIRLSKPPGREYHLDVVIQMAEKLYSETQMDSAQKVEQMIKFLKQSADSFYIYPEIDGSVTPISGAQMHRELPNGLSNSVVEYWQQILATEAAMYEKIGMSNLRLADAGGERQSMNNQFKALEYSQNATFYIPNMLTSIYTQMGNRTMNTVIDILNFKEIDTLAYEFLKTGVGEDCLLTIKGMGKKSPYRFGLYVDALNIAPMVAKLEAVMQNAISQGSLTTAQYLLVSSIRNPKRAFQILAYLEQRNAKLKAKEAAQAQQAQTEALLMVEKEKQKTEIIKGQFALEGIRLQNEAGLREKIITQQGGILKQDQKIRGDLTMEAQKASANFQKTIDDLNGPTPSFNMGQPNNPGMSNYDVMEGANIQPQEQSPDLTQMQGNLPAY